MIEDRISNRNFLIVATPLLNRTPSTHEKTDPYDVYPQSKAFPLSPWTEDLDPLLSFYILIFSADDVRGGTTMTPESASRWTLAAESMQETERRRHRYELAEPPHTLRSQHPDGSPEQEGQLRYQRSGLLELRGGELLLPMIEDDAIECMRSTAAPISTRELPPGAHAGQPGASTPAPMRRARQRIRNYCTML